MKNTPRCWWQNIPPLEKTTPSTPERNASQLCSIQRYNISRRFFAFGRMSGGGILLLLMFSLAASLKAQTPSVGFTLPDSGAVDVELAPTITIETNLKIDSLKVTWGRWGDTIHTINASDTVLPSVLVIEKEVFDTEPDSVWNNYAFGGYYDIFNDSTLTFTPFGLRHATEYVAILYGLDLLDSSSTSVHFNDTIVLPFTTTLPVHQIVSASILPGDPISCRDTITVIFNRPLDSAMTASGPVLEIEKIVDWYLGTGADSTSIVGDSSVVIPSDITLGGDGKSVQIVPQSSLEDGESYRVAVHTQYWTGEPLDDMNIPFVVYSAMQVNVSAASTDTSSSYIPNIHIAPQKGESFGFPGDSILLSAPISHLGWTFVEWKCPEDPSIDGNTSAELTIDVDCSDLHPRTITAFYDPPVECPTLKLLTTTGGKPELYIDDEYSLELDSLGYLANWNVCSGEKVVVVAQADSGYTFSHWISNKPSLNGSISPVLSVYELPSSVNTTLKPAFTAGGSVCASCIGNATVVVDDPRPGLTASDIARLTPNVNGGLLDEFQIPGSCPGGVSFTATVKAQHTGCYEIYQVNAFQEVGGTTGYSQIVQVPPTGNSVSSTATMTSDCKAWVTFHIRRKRYTLTVEQAKWPESPTAEPLSASDNAVIAVNVTTPTDPGAIIQSVPGTTTSGIKYIEYTIKACAGVRIFAQSRSNEIHFEQYSCLSDVECDADPTYPYMNRTMNHNIKVRALFKPRFRLETIELRRHGTITWESFVPANQFVGDVTVEDYVGADWYQNAQIRFTFNDAVDLTTVDGQIQVRELQLRIDRSDLQFYEPANSSSAVWSNGNKVLTMTLKNEGADIGITKIQLAQVFVGKNLKNTLGDFLPWNYTMDIETEYPGLDVTLFEFTPICVGEVVLFHPAHAYVMGSGYFSHVPSSPPVAVAEQTPIGGNHKVPIGNNITIPLTGWSTSSGSELRPLKLIDVAQMSRGDEIMFGAICVEIDGGVHSEQLSTQNIMLSDARSRISNRLFHDDMAWMWDKVTNPWIHSPNPVADDDENIGSVSTPYMFTRLHHFGATRSSPYLNESYHITGIREGKTRFDFINRFIPDLP